MLKLREDSSLRENLHFSMWTPKKNKQSTKYCHPNIHISFFRRISYGNVTHVNISVLVGEDNRAVLGVALDRSDSVYYGCDAGCLDAPVPLSQFYTNFPVKLTKPLTAILYITSDHQHMQELRSALHVHEVDEGENSNFVKMFVFLISTFFTLYNEKHKFRKKIVCFVIWKKQNWNFFKLHMTSFLPKIYINGFW